MWEVKSCEFGKGVFAVEDVLPLTYVGTYLGRQISREKYKQKKNFLSCYVDYCAEVIILLTSTISNIFDISDDTSDISIISYLHFAIFVHSLLVQVRKLLRFSIVF